MSLRIAADRGLRRLCSAAIAASPAPERPRRAGSLAVGPPFTRKFPPLTERVHVLLGVDALPDLLAEPLQFSNVVQGGLHDVRGPNGEPLCDQSQQPELLG